MLCQAVPVLLCCALIVVTVLMRLSGVLLCHAVLCCVQLEAELKDLEQQSSELQVEGQHAISEYKVSAFRL